MRSSGEALSSQDPAAASAGGGHVRKRHVDMFLGIGFGMQGVGALRVRFQNKGALVYPPSTSIPFEFVGTHPKKKNHAFFNYGIHTISLLPWLIVMHRVNPEHLDVLGG